MASGTAGLKESATSGGHWGNLKQEVEHAA